MYHDNFALYTLVNTPDPRPTHDIITRFMHPSNLRPNLVVGGAGADLVNQIWYRMELAPAEIIDTESYYDLIDEIEYKIGGQVIEKYTGTSLRLNSRYEPKSQCSWSPQNEIIFPLCLCAKNLPLICLAYHEVRVDIKLSHKVKDILKSHSFEVEHVYLPQPDRKTIARSSHELAVLQKFAFKNQLTDTIRGRIHDIALRSTCPLLSCTLVLKMKSGEVIKNKKSAIMLSKAIPLEYYGGVPEENTYYFPPLNLYVDPSINELGFEYEFVKETCDVEILVRQENILRIEYGMGGLRHP